MPKTNIFAQISMRIAFIPLIFALPLLWLNPLKAQIPENRHALPSDQLLGYLLPVHPLDAKDEPALTSQGPKKNQFVVYAFRNSLTLIALVDQGGKMGLEEICISKAAFDTLKMSWQQWHEGGYPKALSHFRIDWPKIAEQDEMTPAIQSLFPSNRQPLSGRLLQVLWQIHADPLVLSPSSNALALRGKKRSAQISAFTSHWPDDRSALANKPLLLHFGSTSPHDELDYWPTLIRIGSGFHRQNLIAIASGQFGAVSPCKYQDLR